MKATKTRKKKPYVLTIKLGDTTLTGKGETVLEALQAIPRPLKITTKATLTLTDGQKSCEKLYNIIRTKRLFFPMAQYLWAKQLGQSLK